MISKISTRLSILMRGHFVVLCLMCIGLSGADAFAQNDAGTVKGVVVDASNMTVFGATVLVKRTGDGTVTDIDGNFIITGVQSGDILQFSFVGMKSQDLTYTGQSNLKIQLESTAVGMDELVVVGYGVQKKADLTGAVASVSSDDITRKSVATFEEAMQGLASGVSVTSNSGAPGNGASIRIRGVGTVNGTSPLYIIDGVPSGGPGSTNPADIESISVLKDAAAASIYGSRGANGVIVITTKKGSKGLSINFDTQFGVAYAPKRMNLLNSEEYAKYVNEVCYNDITVTTFFGKEKITHAESPVATQDPYNMPYDTDWQEEMFQLAPQHRHNLSISGGNDFMTFSVSGGYQDQEGTMIETGYKKAYARANTEFTFGKLRFGESMAFNHSDKDNEKNGVGGRNQVEQMLKMSPTIAVYDDTMLGGYAGPTAVDDQDAVNPVGIANLYENNAQTTGVLGNIYAEYEVLEGLKAKGSYSFDFYNSESHYSEQAQQMGDYHIVGDSKWTDSYNESRYNMTEFLLSYSKELDGGHNLSAVAGYSREWSDYDTYTYKKTHYTETDTEEELTTVPQLYEWALVSYFGRFDYSYKSKYMLQATVRRDGSSRFGPENKWAFFPSVSAGWNIQEENFMDGLSDVVSQFKLRGSYGTIGNQNIGDYAFAASLNPYQSYPFGPEADDDSNVMPGTGPTSLPNPELKWETSIQRNIGVDLGFFDSKLNAVVEYYNNKTEDMLISVQMPVHNGSFTFPPQNAGSVQNSGFELMLNYGDYSNEFTYAVTGNFSTVHNEVLDLGIKDSPLIGGFSELGNSQITMVGERIGSFYGYKTEGIYQSENELTREYAVENGLAYAENASVGSIRYKDFDGDNELSSEDRTILGSAISDYSYGFNFQLGYKGFDFSCSFQGEQGRELYRETKIWTEGMNTKFNASTDVNNRYRSEDITITTGTGDNAVSVDYFQNLDTNMPQAELGNTHNILFSDRFIEDGSYLRFKDLTLGYSLNDKVLNRLHLSKVRVYVQGMNLHTWTSYSGYDPEFGTSGIDDGQYPQPRTFLGGIQISL